MTSSLYFLPHTSPMYPRQPFLPIAFFILFVFFVYDNSQVCFFLMYMGMELPDCTWENYKQWHPQRQGDFSILSRYPLPIAPH